MSTPIEALAWLAGHWCRSDGDSVQEEVWLEPRGGLMLGMDRDVSVSGKVAFEHMRIAEEEGGLVFFASLGGKPPIAFRLSAASAHSATFEREGEAFPARIHYRRDGEVLHCRIDGGGRALEWRWPRHG